MKVQNKPDYLIFASDAKTGELQAFPNISRGWGLTTDQTQSKPPLSWMNGAFNRIDENMLYLLQQGVPQWDSAVLYPVDAVIKYKSQLYIALAENDNAIPSSHLDKWQKLIKDTPEASVEQKGIVQLSSAIDSDSEVTAATSRAIKTINDLLQNLILDKKNYRWYSKAIGEIVSFDVDVDLPPTNLQDCRYITLNANDPYNSNILIEQTVSDADPLITATARINLPASKMHGKVIHLINTEKRYIVANSLQNIVRDDAIQNITGTAAGVINDYYKYPAMVSGAFEKGPHSASVGSGSSVDQSTLIFNASRVVRTDTSTHGRDISRIFFMRVL